jgi:hypothetical protein
MKPKYWKYTFDISQFKCVIKRHIVEGNNIRFLKPPKIKSEQKSEIVDEIAISIPLEEYEAFREYEDWGAFTNDERFNKVSLGIKKRLNQEMVNNLKNKLLTKYPLTLIQ